MGDNNKGSNPLFTLVGTPHVIIHIEKEVDNKTRKILGKCGVLVDIGEGYYAVTPECLNKLDVKNIPYSERTRYPIPKEIRIQIRETLKNKGVLAPI
jgi:hypothetical protein